MNKKNDKKEKQGKKVSPKKPTKVKGKAIAKKKKAKVSYVDVFIRVAKYIYEHGSYLIDVGMIYGDGVISFDAYKGVSEDSDRVSMRIGDDDEYLYWGSIVEFLTSTFDGLHQLSIGCDCVNIFEAIACCKSHYDDLLYESLVELVDNLKSLGRVKVKDKTPMGLMNALDKAKIFSSYI